MPGESILLRSHFHVRDTASVPTCPRGLEPAIKAIASNDPPAFRAPWKALESAGVIDSARKDGVRCPSAPSWSLCGLPPRVTRHCGGLRTPRPPVAGAALVTAALQYASMRPSRTVRDGHSRENRIKPPSCAPLFTAPRLSTSSHPMRTHFVTHYHTLLLSAPAAGRVHRKTLPRYHPHSRRRILLSSTMAFVVTAVGLGAPAARQLGRASTTVTEGPPLAVAATPRMTFRGGYPSADAQREAWRRRAANRSAAAGGQPQRRPEGPSQAELMDAVSGMAAEFMRNYSAFGGPLAAGRCGPPAGQATGGRGARQQQRQQGRQQQQQQVDWVPRAERAETPTSYIYRLELPGVGRNVKSELKATDRVIVVSGEKVRPSETANASADAAAPTSKVDVRNCRSELAYGSFSRTLRLPADADVEAKDQIRAAVKDGVLTVAVPKVKVEPEPPAEEPVEIPIM